jgi:hypothetical protein
VREQIAKYAARLLADRSAAPGAAAFAAQDDVIIAGGESGLARLAGDVLGSLSCLALCAARPALPFADFLVRRARPGESRIVPRDTETRTFLHDIPFLRREELSTDPAARIARLLGNRKGVVAEGIGIVANGAVTVEQAYINYSSVFHATFVKYLYDLLADGFLLPGEEEAFREFRARWLAPVAAAGLAFREGPLRNAAEVLEEVAAVGRYTVARGSSTPSSGTSPTASGTSSTSPRRRRASTSCPGASTRSRRTTRRRPGSPRRASSSPTAGSTRRAARVRSSTGTRSSPWS